MSNQFQRILDLVRKTGDTMVVTDQNGQDCYVVMDLDQYEAMIAGLSGEFEDFEEEIDEIEPESGQEWEIPDDFVIEDPEGGLADEPDTHPEPQAPNVPNDLDIWTTMQAANENGQTWDVSQMNHDEMADLETQYQNFVARNVQEAITQTEQTEVKEVTEKPQEDEFSEEQFYLEPID